jgi:membrane protease subunit HflK
MAWNEPGGHRGKDPWGGDRDPEGTPPDLDEVVQKVRNRFRRFFGGGGGAPSGGGSNAAALSLGLVALIGYLAWDMSYIIQPPEQGVVLRFGAYAATLEPGLTFRLPRPIEFMERVNIDQIRSINHKASMLTQDENIVDIELAVQYKIKDVKEYMFKVMGPDTTLEQATESAIRRVIGKSKMDFILTEGRAEVAAGIKDLIQNILDQYQAGLQVTSVNMQPAKPPEEVKSAFDDAIKAREDEQRLINEAEAYKNEIVPKARGGAARMLEEASAYKSRVVAQAEGEGNRFTQLLSEYVKAPEVTRQRLYLDTMESVLSNTAKVLLDAKGGNNLVYLPIDKLMEQKKGDEQPAAQLSLPREAKAATPQPAPSGQTINESENPKRQRGIR